MRVVVPGVVHDSKAGHRQQLHGTLDLEHDFAFRKIDDLEVVEHALLILAETEQSEVGVQLVENVVVAQRQVELLAFDQFGGGVDDDQAFVVDYVLADVVAETDHQVAPELDETRTFEAPLLQADHVFPTLQAA